MQLPQHTMFKYENIYMFPWKTHQQLICWQFFSQFSTFSLLLKTWHQIYCFGWRPHFLTASFNLIFLFLSYTFLPSIPQLEGFAFFLVVIKVDFATEWLVNLIVFEELQTCPRDQWSSFWQLIISNKDNENDKGIKHIKTAILSRHCSPRFQIRLREWLYKQHWILVTFMACWQVFTNWEILSCKWKVKIRERHWTTFWNVAILILQFCF